MRICLFGGSFDPVHTQHVALAVAASKELSLDRLIVIPSATAPHKRSGAHVSGETRLRACEIAFRGLGAQVSRFELDRAETSYSYLTCEHFKALYPEDELFFLVGADMLENFPKWRFPERILNCVTLVAGGRGESDPEEYAERVFQRFGKEVILLPFTGEQVSSTQIRVELAFGKKPPALDGEVHRFLKECGAYTHPAILPALSLEKEERREHSFRVALLAAERAASAGVPQEKAVLAAALHDCGKYVPLSSPMLKGFTLPEGVPPPVVHQYTGAFLAEHRFGISDRDVLNAIRYHTSGRENMSPLEKLILVCDMLEAGREFEGIAELRESFSRSLNEGLLACLTRQLYYLKARNFPVYPLTERALAYIKREMGV